jgi:predicted negative regulator of RcsB-dependent stress response
VREVGDHLATAETLTTLGRALAAEGDRHAARTCWQEAAHIFDDLSDPRAIELRADLADLADLDQPTQASG